MTSNCLNEIFLPGQKVCQADNKNIASYGTVLRNGHIFATVAGICKYVENDMGNMLVQVVPLNKPSQNIVPMIGSVVVVKITNVNPRFCKCAIMAVNNNLLPETFRALIRKEDIRATEKDKVEVYKCFRPGDIVIAKVHSLGDAQAYLLTTAENELGVVIALSDSGEIMLPISWCEMQCPKTLVKEARKVARVHSDYIVNK